MFKILGRTKLASLRRLERGFPAEVAMVLLISFVLFETFSIAGWSVGVTSTFPYPTDKITSLGVSALGLLGVYGLWRSNEAGTYFALLTSVFEVVLGCFSLIKAYSTPQLSPALVASAGAAIILGSLTALSIFKISLHQKDAVNVTSDNSSPPDLGISPPAIEKYTVETKNVTKKYFLGPNVVSAINRLNMKIGKGEFVAIMGPSGSGKSTLLNLIGALDKPSSGQVLIDGVDISTLNEQGLARLRNEKIGFVFQAYNLIARSSVLRNMELPALVKGYPREKRIRKVNGLLGIVGLGDKVLRKPKTLSGGEQQRVAIARALVNDPEIVLADEPTGNVDSKTGRVIMNFLRRLNSEKKTTVIVVTHDPEVAKKTDRTIYLRDGKIVKKSKRGVSA